MLMSVLNFASFTWVMRRPELPRAWVTYGLVNVLFFLTGLLSLLVLPWQYAALALGALGGSASRDRIRRVALPMLTAVGVVGALALYYAEVDLGVRGIRPGAGLLRAPQLVREALDFMTLGDRRELALYLWGAVVAPLYCLRLRRDMLPVVLTLLVIETVSIPLLVKVLQWKQYYFHPRHVLFLLPGLELLAALGICGTVAAAASLVPVLGRRRGMARAVITAVALVLVLGLRLPGVRGFMANPHAYFGRTKTDRDVRGLVRDLRSRTAFYGPGEKYLLIVDRIGPGYLANPTLARYLEWYSLGRRVVLLSTTDMAEIIARLQQGCDGPCRGHSGEEVARALFLLPPFEVSAAKLRLLGLKPSFGTWPGVVRDVGVLVYGGSNRNPDFASSDVWPYIGMVVAEPR
jgi:hypothetical protein